MRSKEMVLNDNLEDISIEKMYSFPFEVSFSEIRKLSKGYVKLHWHDELQISIVTKGSVEFIVGEKSYILKNGQAIFINTQRIHMAKSVGDEDCIYHSINFDAKLLKMFPGSIIEQKYIEPVLTAENLNSIEFYGNSQWEKDILGHIGDIINADVIKQKGYELKIYISLLNFWLLLVENENDIFSKKTEPKPINEQRVKDVLSFIHRNYGQKITLQDIADSVFVSKGECCRFFKKSVKMSPYDYLINYRINESMKLLKGSNSSILDIAERVGFNNVSHYIQIFRKKTGLTPHEYRNSKQE
ncbi:AraC family transcriptional regulator [Intestinibacter sp.]|uniref:AraC family transcriptional regulator n=1 Tax=Intestinibacter sp. TaxID=1965304 RepID=UPI002A74A7BA|nr:AraC family transcriptional regulator [Intestinibacter sp.]MDY2737739.1 AraC family transcriptional regulator [Intestinibacter sp.]MDY4573528.1 AraC family transcriptional regulator [Intestinibacter sp.]